MADPVTTTVPEPTPSEPLAPVSSPSAPLPDNTTQTADAATLQAQLQKLEMERNMLRKQKDALEKEKSEKTRTELEEKEDYRTLAERAQAELDTLRRERDAADNEATVKTATADVYKDFPENVRKIAETAGMNVTDDSDEAKATLKTKLEAIKAQVGTVTGTPVVPGNNPAPSINPETPDRSELIGKMRFDNHRTREEAVRTAVGSLDIIKTMKQMSGREAQEI